LLQVLHSSTHAYVAERVAEQNHIGTVDNRLKVGRVVNFVFILVERMDELLVEREQLALVIVLNEVGYDVRRFVVVLERGNLFSEKYFDDIA
jgi:hypothetical protein